MSIQISRRTALLGGLGMAALAGCNGTAVQQANNQSSSSASGAGLTIGPTYIPNIQFAPFYWAADKGLFAKEGVAATLRHHGASEALFAALTAGREQLVIAGGDEVVQARSQGMDLVTVAGYYQRYPVVLIVPQSSSIKSLADLKGRKIGIPGRYGESWFGLQLALRNAKLTASDVTIVEIGYTQQAALATGKVDAIVGFSNNDVVQFAQSKVAVRTIALGTDVPLVSSSLVTTRDVLTRQQQAVKAACRAVVAGIQGVVSDPAQAITVSANHVPGLTTSQAQSAARATLDATLPLWKGSTGTPTGKLQAADFQKMASFMYEAKLISKAVDASKCVDTSVVG